MPKTVIFIYKFIIILKIFLSRIVWRIDIDDINLSGMSVR